MIFLANGGTLSELDLRLLYVYLEEVFVSLLDGLLPDLARVPLTDILSVTIMTLTPALAP